MQDNKHEVLGIVKQQGPLLPRDIVKVVGGDTFLVGAVLSQLSVENQIKITNVKKGGSPFYYANGQEFKLQQLSEFLNEKDRKAFEELKLKKVLRDSTLTPLMRVSLRTIKDYSRPIEVNANNEKVLFWKWYLTPNSEIEPIIRRELGMQKTMQDKSVEQNNVEKQKQMLEPIPQAKQKKLSDDTSQETPQGEFMDMVTGYFRNNNIKVIEKNIIRKSSEVDFVIRIPSPVGDLSYYCKAKSKKKTNDGDLSSAYMKAQMKKLPLLYIMTGDLTKRANDMLSKELSSVTVKQI